MLSQKNESALCPGRSCSSWSLSEYIATHTDPTILARVLIITRTFAGHITRNGDRKVYGLYIMRLYITYSKRHFTVVSILLPRIRIRVNSASTQFNHDFSIQFGAQPMVQRENLFLTSSQ